MCKYKLGKEIPLEDGLKVLVLLYYRCIPQVFRHTALVETLNHFLLCFHDAAYLIEATLSLSNIIIDRVKVGHTQLMGDNADKSNEIDTQYKLIQTLLLIVSH